MPMYAMDVDFRRNMMLKKDVYPTLSHEIQQNRDQYVSIALYTVTVFLRF
jgi:hypothetical protein